MNQTIGLLGGGQLGKMFAVAASRYGVKTVSLSPEVSPIITHVAEHICGEYDDTKKLDMLLQKTQIVTLEFENIPVSGPRYLAEYTHVRPGIAALEIAQDRRLEKNFFKTSGIPIAHYAVIDTQSDIDDLDTHFTFPAILKTARDGYDGKGQVKVADRHELLQAWQQLQQVPCVLEAFVAFEKELSVIIARGVAGDYCIYGPFHNEHENHILATSWSGVQWSNQLQKHAQEIALTLAENLDYIGVLCIELFLVGDELMVNEMAPRPHNSGHLTIEGFTSSQFDQQVRATLGLPIAPAECRGPCAMINLISQSPRFEIQQQIFKMPGVHWHWYGKNFEKPGRKLGHITIEANTFVELQAKVIQIKQVLMSNQ